MHHAFLYICLPSLYENDVKMPNFTFRGEREYTRQQLYFSFPELRCSLLEFNSRKNCQHLTERDRISAIKFEAARLHFFNDVFVADAVVVA